VLCPEQSLSNRHIQPQQNGPTLSPHAMGLAFWNWQIPPPGTGEILEAEHARPVHGAPGRSGTTWKYQSASTFPRQSHQTRPFWGACRNFNRNRKKKFTFLPQPNAHQPNPCAALSSSGTSAFPIYNLFVTLGGRMWQLHRNVEKTRRHAGF
jgi:hypothetical protein